MIGKLIKNDLKSGIRIMGNIYLAAAIAIGAMLFSALFNNGILKFLCSAAVIGITLVAVVVTFASVVFGTNKSLFGREGYLTQTLPVRTSSLIFSKWLSSSIWVILSYTLAAVAIVGVFVYWTMENQEGAEIYEMIYSFAQSFGIGAEKVYKSYFAISAVIGLFNACIFVMFIMFSITLSNINPFHKLGSFGVILYLAATILIIQGASNGLEKLCDISLVITESGMTMTVDSMKIAEALATGGAVIGFTGVYFKVIVTVFLYILTVQLTETKINLK